MQVFVVCLFVLIGLVAAEPYGYIPHHGGPHCTKELVTISATLCKLDYNKECTTETKVIGDHVKYEKGECEEVEICTPVHFVPRLGHYRKREASGYESPECEKATKEVCKQVPVSTPVEKEVEICVSTPVEVCEPVEQKVPKITCEKLKH